MYANKFVMFGIIRWRYKLPLMPPGVRTKLISKDYPAPDLASEFLLRGAIKVFDRSDDVRYLFRG